MKCVNCDNTATYLYTPFEGHTLEYCSKDLPGFLKDRAVAGLLEITETSKQEVTDAIAILNETSVPVIEEEPLIEEPVVVEEKATPKKTTKKAEPVQPTVE
jgi:hypothetical protein